MRYYRYRWLRAILACLLYIAMVNSLLSQAASAKYALSENAALSSDVFQAIDGKHSLIATYDEDSPNNWILHTLPGQVRLRPGKSYIAAFRYKILKVPDKPFVAMFLSDTAAGKGEPIPSREFTGAAGESGAVELRATLGPYSDYKFQLNLLGKSGVIAIDSFLLKEPQEPAIIFAEDFEEPSISQGRFPFVLDPPVTYPLGSDGLFYTLRSAKGLDLDGDQRLETVLTITTYPEQTPQPILILANKGQASDMTSWFFPESIPKVKHSPQTYSADLDQDGRNDLILAEAGLDIPPWTGSRIVVALMTTDGRFKDVSGLIPRDLWNTRSYILGVGDLDKNNTPDILLPDQNEDSRTAILTWTKDGFREKKDWITKELWYFPGKLAASNHLEIADFDGDKYGDILCGGGWDTPSTRIAFGSAGGFLQKNIVLLPDSVFGHTSWEEWEGAETYQGGACIGALTIDLNNDGKKDLFEVQEQTIGFRKGFAVGNSTTDLGRAEASGGSTGAACSIQIFMNKGNRRFEEIKPASAGEFLSWRYYISLLPIDLNNDGFLDVVGGYWTKQTSSQMGNIFGTTFFLNDGTGYFRIVEGFDILPVLSDSLDRLQGQLGIFMPTSLTEEGFEGLFIDSWSDYRSGSLTVRRGVTGSSFGTGPDFQNSADLGFPGFNEDYYLRHYSDARSAVLAGMFDTALEHYRYVGISRGYKAFAPNAAVHGTKGNDILHLGIRSADAKIEAVKDGYSVADTSGKYGTLTLFNIEKLAFMDGMVDIPSNNLK